MPTLKTERGWHGLFDGVVGRAELPTIWRTLDDYVILCGAGYSEDGTVIVVPHDRVIAHILVDSTMSVAAGGSGRTRWSTSPRMCSILHACRTSPAPSFSSLAVPLRAWHLPVQFDVARDAVLKILRDAGCTAYSGESMFVDLSWHRHVKPNGHVDYWHFKECVATVTCYDHWLELIMQFTACSVLPVAWLHMHRHTVPLTVTLPSQLRNSSLDEYDAFAFWPGGESIPAVAERLGGGGLSPAAGSGGGSLSSASEVITFTQPTMMETAVPAAASLGQSLAALAQTMDDDSPGEAEQRRRNEEEEKVATTTIEVPEGGETQTWVRNLGDTARWDRYNDEGVMVSLFPPRPLTSTRRRFRRQR